MISVLFDHQTFSMQAYGGISRYFANIHDADKQLREVKTDISLLRSKNHYIRDFPAPLNNFLGALLLPSDRKCFKWNKVYSEYRIKKNNYDVLHPTYYDPYFLKHTKKPYVITVHDMIHELYPEFFDPGDKFVNYKRLCVEQAAHIIAISDSTKEDLQHILGIKEERISVIHHGYVPSTGSQHLNPTSATGADYLLFVGDRRGYKNFPRFLTAIVPVLRKNPALKLICVGGGPFQSAETELLHRLNVQNRVIQNNVSDEELGGLYANALAFIYPSLYEGFGFPILEAFNNNCPVIASDNKCFREIGQDGVAYFNPLDPHQIAAVVEECITNTDLRNKLTDRGRKLLPGFSLDTCIDKTLAVYRKIV